MLLSGPRRGEQPRERSRIRSLLREAGFEPVEAGDGETAREAIRRKLVDVALLELEWPGMAGTDVLNEA